MWRKLAFVLVCSALCFALNGQGDTIYLRNASFEDFPGHSQGVRNWIDCGFPGETPPDVQPFRSSQVAAWGQLIPAFDGNTYLGMVVRDNDTYERVCQRLSQPLQQDQCYQFSVYLTSSDHYISQSHKTRKLANYVKPTVLRIWGGNDYCDRRELLSESTTISNKEWKKYDFEFNPAGNYSYIMLEAFYKTPTLIVYNGNILVDNASPIIQTTCPGDEPLLAAVEEEVEADPIPEPVVQPPPKPEKKPEEEKPTPIAVEEEKITQAPQPPKQRVLKNLDREKIKKGQTIRIENLYFEADTATIDTTSVDVLEEIAYFLAENGDIIVEIGGHTNGRPTHEYCDKLSTARAKSVADYLRGRGIPEDQVKYKGYGKRKPLASNQTKWGRQRNQRVEIRILGFDGLKQG